MKIIYHPAVLEHKVEEEYPEKPERIEQVLEAVPFLAEGIERLARNEKDPYMASCESGEQFLALFHSPLYVKRIQEQCRDLGEDEIIRIEDNCFSRGTYKAACYAVGASLEAARWAKKGQKSFALVRPPGHHAGVDRESGFCVFNNVAIATEFLRRQNERVMIIDIDLHLGDGTIEYVDGREDVFYFSINQQDIWPNFMPEERTNMENIFLPEATKDDVYIATLQERLVPALQRFKPSMVAVSAGFDTHGNDYAPEYLEDLDGGFLLTHRSYKELWGILDKHVVPYFAVLEGGYNPLSVMAGLLSFVEKDKQE